MPNNGKPKTTRAYGRQLNCTPETITTASSSIPRRDIGKVDGMARYGPEVSQRLDRYRRLLRGA